ncbi:hypothetical protein EDF81_0315 [Enterobacter sp. BIGb0383]|uniref:hypothetical protein n=1 Tax=unclassified Enterobacter TaxID=2608935 RepID=UPI000FA2C370|nr:MULTISPECIES: hypothetical protein [unclassified Enterobacter]ROP61841.1 hypothetical protein EDF81_0315 [Enterobacter sp. BIGb0383]ROS12002.1 hypothetical protein EC848_0315 [Enterobacter sp. BIGb0359]
MGNTTRMGSERPKSYALRLCRQAEDESATEKIISSAEIDRLTPPGMKITASLDEMLSMLTVSMQNIKRQSHPVYEAIGSVRLQQPE